MYGTGIFRKKGGGLRALSAILILITVLTCFLGGCAVSANDKDEAAKSESVVSSDRKKIVNAPVNSDYFISNNLEVESVSVTAENGRTGEYLVVSGLANSVVQDKINEKLYSSFMKYLQNNNPPPYRGARLQTAEYGAPKSVYIGMNLTGNINNILSVTINREMYYGENYDLYYSDIIPINIDLNTGKSFKLSDMFADNIDYEAFVNDTVWDAIENSDFDSEDYSYYDYGDYPNLRLTAPFTGISENQRFYVNGRDGSISLIIDYRMPEFYTEGTYELLTIPYNNKMAVTKRFMDRDSIFEDRTVNMILKANDGYAWEDRNLQSEDISYGRVYAELRTIYYEKQPDYIVKKIKKLVAAKDDFIAAFNEKYAEYALNYGEENITAVVNMYVYSDRIAGREYIQFEQYGSIYPVNLSDASSLNMRNAVYITYDSNGDIMDIDDLFKNPEKKIELLEKAVLANIKDYYDAGALWPVNVGDFIEVALGHANGFYLSADALHLSYDCDLQSLASGYFGISYEDAERYEDILQENSLEFSDIGCGSMTIF